MTCGLPQRHKSRSSDSLEERVHLIPRAGHKACGVGLLSGREGRDKEHCCVLVCHIGR